MNSHDTAIKIILQISSMDQFTGTHVCGLGNDSECYTMRMNSQILSPVCNTIRTSTELCDQWFRCSNVLPESDHLAGVYIWWNGIVEWNSGMDYWNGGMLYRTYLII